MLECTSEERKGSEVCQSGGGGVPMLDCTSEEQEADMWNDIDLESMGYGLYLEWGECRDSAEWAWRAMASCYVLEEQASRIRRGELEEVLEECGAAHESVKEEVNQSGGAHEGASEELEDDRTVGKEWVKREVALYYILEMEAERYNYSEVVKEAVKQNGEALRYDSNIMSWRLTGRS